MGAKPQFHLIPLRSILGVMEVLTQAIDKHDKDGDIGYTTDEGKTAEEYWDGIFRHLFADKMGELIDKETGKPHLDCAAADLLIYREKVMPETTSENPYHREDYSQGEFYVEDDPTTNHSDN